MVDLFHPTRTAEVLALAVRVRSGDGQALATLAVPIRARLASFLRGVGTGMDADCWSAALVRVWQACLDRGPRAIEVQPSPQGWLVRCAHNAARDVARKMRRHSAREIPCGPAGIMTLVQEDDTDIRSSSFARAVRREVFEASIDADEQRDHARNLTKLEAAIECLTPLSRALFHERYTLGRSQEATARYMGLSQPTVSRIEKAMLARLRALIG